MRKSSMGSMARLRRRMDKMGLRQVRRVVVFVIGMTVLLLGIVMLVLPGPAIIVIPAGLGILGLEFRWARNWLKRAKLMFDKGLGTVRGGRNSAPAPQPPSTSSTRD
jgi:uncharacterized protein (TIGR02611 family)